MTPADIAAVTGSNNGGGMFGDNGAWWIIVLFLFAGWGRNFSGGGGSGSNGGYATPADVRSAVDQQTLISKLDQQTYGLADATFALNNTITSGFSNAELSRCNQQAALMAALNNMSMNDMKCCCETQRLIERGFCDTNNTLHNTTRDVIDNQNANARAILDALNTQRYEAKVAENQSLRDQLFFATLRESQTAQNGYLISQLREPCPIPAYTVPNPNCCYNSCGYNG